MEEIKKIYPKQRVKFLELASLIDSEDTMQEIANLLYKRFAHDFRSAQIKMLNKSHAKCDLKIKGVYPRKSDPLYNIQLADGNDNYEICQGTTKYLADAEVTVKNIPVEIYYPCNETEIKCKPYEFVELSTDIVECISMFGTDRQSFTLTFLIRNSEFNYVKLKLSAINALYLTGRLGYYVNKLITK